MTGSASRATAALGFVMAFAGILGGCARDLPLATPPLVSCGGASEALALGIDPPTPPRPYRLDINCDTDPAWACVETTEELFSLVESAEPGQFNIILENGVYEPHEDETRTALRLRRHRLWARDQGGAMLKFGVDAGGNNPAFIGGELHGLVIDLDDDQHAFRSSVENPTTAAIATWGAGGDDLLVADTVIRGPGINSPVGVHIGVLASAETADFRAERLRVEDFLRFGVLFDGGEPPQTPRAEISDALIRNIGDSIASALACDPAPIENRPFACGAQEHGLWIGGNATVDRIFVRDVGHSGIVTANQTDGAVLQHLDVDRTGIGGTAPGATGLAIELTTRNTEFRRFCIGPDTRFGVKSEWDNNPAGAAGDSVFLSPIKAPRGLYNSISDGLVESSYVGASFDQGTVDSSIEQVTFRGYSRAGIAMYRNVAEPLDYSDDLSLPTAGDYLANVGGSQSGNVFQFEDGTAAVDDEERCRFTRGRVGTLQELPCENP